MIHPPKKWNEPEKHFNYAIESPWYKLIFKMLAEFYNITNIFFQKREIVPALMPITASSVSSPMGLGSDSLPVNIKLFGEDTYLSDSMQFQLEYLLRQGYKGVYYIMPTFRGENPDKRHLNQFFHSEVEIVGNLDEVMKLAEGYVRACSNVLLKNHYDEIKSVCRGKVGHIRKLIDTKTKFSRISFQDARKILDDSSNNYSKLPGGIVTISTEGEKNLIKYFNAPVWLTHLPALATPFYQAKSQNHSYSLAADLLLGYGEVIGCGERHFDYYKLYDSLREHGVDPEKYAWYLRLKKEYPLRTSGFGLGIERFFLWLLRHDDIRDLPIINRLKNIKSIP